MGLIVLAPKTGISDHFAARLRGMRGSSEAIAYVVGVLGKRRWGDDDLSGDPVTLVYAEAQERGDFALFQRVGDWALFSGVVVPTHLGNDDGLVETLGRLSYYRCFRLMGQQWRVYEELADELPRFIAEVRKRLVQTT